MIKRGVSLGRGNADVSGAADPARPASPVRGLRVSSKFTSTAGLIGGYTGGVPGAAGAGAREPSGLSTGTVGSIRGEP